MQTSTQANDLIKKEKKKLKKYKLSYQPRIILVGKDFNALESISISVDSHQYQAKSILEAIDHCYKLFYVLNIEYPRECQHTWLLLQKFLFNVWTEEDEKVCNTKFRFLANQLENME